MKVSFNENVLSRQPQYFDTLCTLHIIGGQNYNWHIYSWI